MRNIAIVTIEEFLAMQTKNSPDSGPNPGTVSATAAHYFASTRFAQMPEGRRKSHEAFIKELVAKAGDKHLANLRQEDVQRMLAHKAAMTDVDTANRWLSAIKALARFAADWEMRKDWDVAFVAPLKPEKIEPQKLYVIRATGTGRIKIGIAQFPESRLSYLQVGSPLPLEIVATFAIESPRVELEAHQVLAPLHSHGEWFDLGGLGDYFINRIKRDANTVTALFSILRDARFNAVPTALKRGDA